MDYESQGPLHQMFERQARLTPDNVAVVGGDGRTMTFRELDKVTAIVAANLRMRGVLPDTVVGIYMEKCAEYVIAYISILRAGGAYMPMDVSYPIPLLEDIFSDATPVAVFTEESLTQYIPDNLRNVIKCTEGWIERLREENAGHMSIPPQPKLSLENLAFTVYSSGTTGKPKGIQMSHRGVIFSYHWRHENHPYSGGDREACNVFFVWEMLRPILKGVPMYIIPDNVIYDPVLLCRFLADNEITRILFTPSLLEAVLDTKGAALQDSMRSMREIIFCGEVVTVGLLERCIKAFPSVHFLNLYSISEAHDIACADLSTWYQSEKANLQKRKFCPVGKLLPGISVVIMNEELQPQPMGVAGEIYIGGPTLARGYLNRPELNAKRFIARPDYISPSVGDRLYKAGDWGYMLSDGSFEICGRCDTMVKIRGYSIETQAVEASLLELPMVKACVVVVMGAEGEDKYLVAYLVPEGNTASKKEVRAALKRRLPFYMIPSYFIFLNSIPILASSGKLDKKKLPVVNRQEAEVDPEGAPTTDTERALVPLWADVLHMKVIDVQESFFDLGGHSLLATKLLSRVREKFGQELSVKDLFIYPTISAMARLLNMRSRGEVAGETNGILAAPTIDLPGEVHKYDHAVLSMDIQLRSFWRSMQYGDRWNKARVLLTGGTGFLGTFLLRELILNTKTHVFCLVREPPGDEPLSKRLRTTLVQYGVLNANPTHNTPVQESFEALYTERVTAIKGDVGLMNMGMSEEDYHYLCTEVDVIIHAAAYVNLIYPYEALAGPNVVGTGNVLIFACTSKIKPLHYVSTDAVFPHGLRDCPEDADMQQYPGDLSDGYSQSKWVAEQLVRRAMDRGLPAAIYRPGNLSGDSKQAQWNPSDFTLLFLQGCFQVHAAPDVDWDMEMTPVDFTASFIVTLIRKMALGLGKVYHLTNTATIKSKWLFEWLNAHGYKMKLLPYTDWIKLVETKADKNSALKRLVDSMARDESFFSQLSTYQNANVLKVLQILKLSYPAIDHQLLSTYFWRLAQRRVIPPVRRNTTLDLPLRNKVAIVTGASSGIGAAVSLHLAKAGAKVAIAARREDKLQQVKDTIESEGGIVIAIKTDITDRKSVGDLVRHTEYTLGPVDILVNNAGIMHYTMMKNLHEDEWHRQVDLNCKGLLNCIGAVLDGLVQRKQGHIVNMSSDAGRRGFPGLAVYSGTKFFIEGLSQALRHELAKTGVKVTCIQPGDVRTELVLNSNNTDDEAKEAFDGSSSTTVLEPADIGRAVVYAVTQPPFTSVNEILIEPREAPI